MKDSNTAESRLADLIAACRELADELECVVDGNGAIGGYMCCYADYAKFMESVIAADRNGESDA